MSADCVVRAGANNTNQPVISGDIAVTKFDASGNVVWTKGLDSGGSLDDICRVDVFVRNIEDFERIHKVRREFFKPPLPASTLVEVSKMVAPDYLIEINAIAVLPETRP